MITFISGALTYITIFCSNYVQTYYGDIGNLSAETIVMECKNEYIACMKSKEAIDGYSCDDYFFNPDFKDDWSGWNNKTQ